jgi:uncharacterized membrane protein YkoI
MTRTRKLLIGTGVAALLVGGAATIAVAQQNPTPPDLDRAAQVAADAVDGEVVGVEQDVDGTYDVELRRPDGTEVDVDLSASFEVVRTEIETDRDDPDDDRPVDEATRARAADAALAADGDGVVAAVERDDGGYEVEIRHADGTESEVTLDADLHVVHVERDDD